MLINDKEFDQILEKVKNRISGFDFTDLSSLSEEVIINLVITTHISQICFDDPFAFLPLIMGKERTKKASKVFLEEILNNFDSPEVKPMIEPLGLTEAVAELRERLKDA